MVSEEVRPSANKKKFASKMRSIVSAVKTAQRLEVHPQVDDGGDDDDSDDDGGDDDGGDDGGGDDGGGDVKEKRIRWNLDARAVR